MSKAIGRDNFSIGAETEEVDAAVDGIELLEITELMDENDDCGRSVYKTSWLFADGKETAVAVMVVDAVGAVAWTNDKFSLSLSGGALTLEDDVGSIARRALA